MEISIRSFRQAVKRTFDDLARTGTPTRVVNAGKRGSPTEAVLVPPELWDEIATLPTVKRKRAEHEAAAQRHQHEAKQAA